MDSQGGFPAAGERPLASGDAFTEYRRLASALASRASWLGSRDPEAAAQEALRRSIENPKSQSAVAYYFSDAQQPPEWPLDQLLAWLHGVLQFVVREEQSRQAFRRESPARALSDPADSSISVLEAIIDREMDTILKDCFSKLDNDYKQVLELRMGGLKYNQIAERLGMNENTVATRVSRGIRELGQRMRKRIGRRT